MSLKDKIGIITENLYTLEQNLKRVDAKPSSKVLILTKEGKELFHGERRELKGEQLQSKVKSLNKSINKEVLVYVMMEEPKQGSTSKDKFIDEHVIVATVPKHEPKKVNSNTTKNVNNSGSYSGDYKILSREKVTQGNFIKVVKTGKANRVGYQSPFEVGAGKIVKGVELEEKYFSIIAKNSTPKKEMGVNNPLKWNESINKDSLRGSTINRVKVQINNGVLDYLIVTFANGTKAFYLPPVDFIFPKTPEKLKATASTKYTATQNTARLNLAKRIVISKVTKSRPTLQGINVREGLQEFTDSYQLYQLRNEDLLVGIPEDLYVNNKKHNYPDLEPFIKDAKRVNPVKYNVKVLKQLVKESSVIEGSNFPTKYVRFKGAIGDTLVNELYVKNAIKMLGLKDHHVISFYNRSKIRPTLIENNQGSIAILLPTRYDA